jgi:hypothetical protein
VEIPNSDDWKNFWILFLEKQKTKTLKSAGFLGPIGTCWRKRGVPAHLKEGVVCVTAPALAGDGVKSQMKE